MSGHSHWAGIKHRKGLNDAKRGQIFTKHGKSITLAAREGGGKPEANFQLRLAIERAKLNNLPKENIERAIKRGTGELKDQAEIQEILYEAYGPGQVAMLIKTATDNKNRTLGEVRTILGKFGGKLVSSGSVRFLFKLVGVLETELPEEKKLSEIEMQLIEAGAEDLENKRKNLSVVTQPGNLQKIKEILENLSLKIIDARLAYLPRQKISLTQDAETLYEKLLGELDNQEDVQEIFDNL